MTNGNTDRFVGFIGILVSIIAGAISLYAQYTDPKTGFIFFLALIGAILTYFMVSWAVEYFRTKLKIIEENSSQIKGIRKDLNIVKEKIDYNRQIAKLDARTSLIEKLITMKNKKGMIDPRWVVIVIILMLLLLYLKAKGIF